MTLISATQRTLHLAADSGWDLTVAGTSRPHAVAGCGHQSPQHLGLGRQQAPQASPATLYVLSTWKSSSILPQCRECPRLCSHRYQAKSLDKFRSLSPLPTHCCIQETPLFPNFLSLTKDLALGTNIRPSGQRALTKAAARSSLPGLRVPDDGDTARPHRPQPLLKATKDGIGRAWCLPRPPMTNGYLCPEPSTSKSSNSLHKTFATWLRAPPPAHPN